jgi:hypothetical protein
MRLTVPSNQNPDFSGDAPTSGSPAAIRNNL